MHLTRPNSGKPAPGYPYLPITFLPPASVAQSNTDARVEIRHDRNTRKWAQHCRPEGNRPIHCGCDRTDPSYHLVHHPRGSLTQVKLKVSEEDFAILMAILDKCQKYVGGQAPSFDDGINQIINICKPLIQKSLEECVTVLADINQDCEGILSH
jgi:hypothetical protein